MNIKIYALMSLFLFAAFVIGCQNATTTAAVTNNSVPFTQPTPSDDAPRISLADAKADFDKGDTIFVDTRADVSYKQEHIKGAINIPLGTLDSKIGELSKSKKIIAYCS